jgi:hypothetical protein
MTAPRGVVALPVNRAGGWLAIASGLLGALAFGLLLAALIVPQPNSNTTRRFETLFLWQDGAVILQTVLMVALTLSLHALIRSQSARWSRIWVGFGLLAQTLLLLSLLLLFAGVSSDMLYMAPQGLLGVWLIVTNALLAGVLGRSVRVTGQLAGLGLSVIGLGFLTFALFVAPAVLTGPLTSAQIDALPWNTPNQIAHIGMMVGTLVGLTTYPIWTLLLGRTLLRTAA